MSHRKHKALTTFSNFQTIKNLSRYEKTWYFNQVHRAGLWSVNNSDYVTRIFPKKKNQTDHRRKNSTPFDHPLRILLRNFIKTRRKKFDPNYAKAQHRKRARKESTDKQTAWIFESAVPDSNSPPFFSPYASRYVPSEYERSKFTAED